MKSLIRSLLLSCAVCLAASPAFAAESAPAQNLPQGTNTLERMHLKNANCTWTKEIGDAIYQCLKENFGMNAHWCHNEAMETLCPKQLESAKVDTPAAK
jgi:hypothetical protein